MRKIQSLSPRGSWPGMVVSRPQVPKGILAIKRTGLGDRPGTKPMLLMLPVM